MTEIPDGSWTCYACGLGIQSSNRQLFNLLVTEHLTNCDKLAAFKEADEEDE